jgi:hypothetical protein
VRYFEAKSPPLPSSPLPFIPSPISWGG